MKFHSRVMVFLAVALATFSIVGFNFAAGAGGATKVHKITSNRHPIVVGSTMGLTGVVSVPANSAHDGAQAYFDKINAAGGVHGHKIKFTTLDDGFSTAQAVLNTQQLVKQDHIFSMFYIFSTPATVAVQPYLNTVGVPDFGPQAPVRALLNPVEPGLFIVSTSWYQQGATLAHYAVKDDKASNNIAVFYENDSVGDDGYAGIVNNLATVGQTPIYSTTFPATTTNFTAQVVAAKQAGAQTVIVFGISPVMAGVLKAIQQQGWTPNVLTASTGADPNVAKLEGTAGYGSISVSPYDLASANTAAVNAYVTTLAKYFPSDTTSTFSLQGYAEAELFVKGLANAGINPTPKTFISALNTFKNVNIGLTSGPITWTKHNHGGVNVMNIVKNESGTLVQIGTVSASN